MDLEEKFAYFETQVNEQAQDIIDKQVNQYQETLQKDYDEYTENIRREYDTKLENAQKDMRKEFNKSISQSQIHQQRDLYVEEEKLKKSLFAEFYQALQDYMNTNEYEQQLIKMIGNVKQFADKAEESYVVYINHTDREFLPELLDATNADIQVSDRDFIGGVRGVLKKRQILIDYSFTTLLENVQNDFTIEEVED